MPSTSKSQQQFFGMVHAYQSGTLKNASSKVKDAATSISKDDSGDFAKHRTEETVTDFPANLTEDDVQRMQTIIQCLKSGQSCQLDGVDIDTFSARLILLAAHKLSKEQRMEFFHLPIQKMIAVSYKMATS
mgnify:CR=1 FL=1